MFSSYEIGTEVKWNEDNRIQTGVVKQIITNLPPLDVDGQVLTTATDAATLRYLIERPGGAQVVLPHRVLMRRHVNDHT